VIVPTGSAVGPGDPPLYTGRVAARGMTNDSHPIAPGLPQIADPRRGAAGTKTAVGVARRWLPLWLPVALVIPSLVWIALDHSIWPWDPAWYGTVSVDLWATLRTDPVHWPGLMADAFGAKPPAVAWLGQLFVPLGEVLGDDARALLLSIVLCQAASLSLVYLAVRRLDGVPAAVLATLLVGASPLFVRLSHEYFAEPIQTVSVAWLLLILAGAAYSPPALTLAQLPGALALGMLAKLSSPAYMAPLAVGAVVLILLHRRTVPQLRRTREWAAVVVAGAISLLLVLGALAWYRVNVDAALEHARNASADTGLYGVDRGFVRQFPDWFERLGDVAFIRFGWIVAGGLAILGLALAVAGSPRMRLRDPRLVTCAACGAAAILVLASLASQSNQEIRYLLPLVPLVAVPVALAVAVSRRRTLVTVAGAVIVAQFAVVTLQSFGHAPGALRSSYAVDAPVRDTRLARALDSVVTQTCTDAEVGRISMVGADYPWLNHNTLTFLAHRRFSESGRRCNYTALGYAEQDPGAAWERVRETDPPFYVGIDYGNPRNPLPATQAAAVAQDDAFNRVNVAVLDRVRRSPRFELVPGSRSTGLVIFRAVDASH
jgi:4-amino-4-deoxy-L-arabinose transferase-like glycosyltransferase